MAGEPVLIYGHLAGPGNADQLIRLYHRVNPHLGLLPDRDHAHRRSRASTSSRAPTASLTPTAAGSCVARTPATAAPCSSPSQALVSLTADNDGRRHPAHRSRSRAASSPRIRSSASGSRSARGTGDDWHTIKAGFTRAGSSYRIDYRWSIPGAYDVRTVLSGDRRDARSYSDPVSVIIQQAQRPYFSINSSAPVIKYGSSATLSGVLDKVGTTTAGRRRAGDAARSHRDDASTRRSPRR